MKYPITETFYSIIGEGEWTGCPAFFIRLAGCNLNCAFCDTDYEQHHEASPEQLYKEALLFPARKVVITGGEPTIHELKPLTDIFRKEFKMHLETNGVKRPDSFDFDWIAVSPKKGSLIDSSMLEYASEVKFLCGFEGWQDYMENCLLVTKGHKWLLPIANGLCPIRENINMAINYCLEHPEVKFCCQVHKMIGVR